MGYAVRIFTGVSSHYRACDSDFILSNYDICTAGKDIHFRNDYKNSKILKCEGIGTAIQIIKK